MPEDSLRNGTPHSGIVAWLDNIGLGQLYAVLAKQQIAFEDPPNLSEPGFAGEWTDSWWESLCLLDVIPQIILSVTEDTNGSKCSPHR